MTPAIEFLEKIGKPVNLTANLKVGDIIGTQGNLDFDIRLYYIDSINKPSPPHLGPWKPYLIFKAPHYGMSIKDGKVCRQYIHTPMPGTWDRHIWYELDEKQVADFIKEIKDDEDIEDIKNWWFPIYLIQDEGFKKLGSLIKDVEVPYWGFMASSIEGEAPIYEFVAGIKG